MKIVNNVIYVSPFELTKKSIGKNLGGYLYNYATHNKIKKQFQEISNAKYTGKITMYPLPWLFENFTTIKQNFENNIPININAPVEDDLPF